MILIKLECDRYPPIMSQTLCHNACQGFVGPLTRQMNIWHDLNCRKDIMYHYVYIWSNTTSNILPDLLFIQDTCIYMCLKTCTSAVCYNRTYLLLFFIWLVWITQKRPSALPEKISLLSTFNIVVLPCC